MKNKIYISLLCIFSLAVSAKLNAQCSASYTYTQGSGYVYFTSTSTTSFSSDCHWDYGDGSPVDMGSNPSHSYAVAGIYYVCLTVNDTQAICTDTACMNIVVNIGCNNLADSITVTNASSSSACDGACLANVTGGTSPYAYQWTNAANTVSISNLCTGNYGITVTDANGCTVNTIASVGCPPFCQAGFNSYVNANTVFFNNTSNDTTNATFQWAFGDATSSSIVAPYHTYASAGSYNVMMIMVNGFLGCTDTVWQTVYPGGPSSCASSFSMVQDSFNLLQWYIYPTFSGQSPFTYLWDFGDATTSTLANPNHTYSTPGQYTICLSVTDANACTSYFCDSSSVQRSAATLQMQYATVINTTGIEEQEEFMPKLFPDPANDNLYFVLAKPAQGKIVLSDVTGKTVLTRNFEGQQTSIDVSGLPAGIYNCSFTGVSFSTNKKIVVIH